MTSDKYPMNDVQFVLNQLRSIASSVMRAAEASTLEQVLERIAQAARDLIQARYAALGVPDGQGGLKFFKTSGMSAEEIAMMDHLPEGHGLIGAIMAERRTLRLESMRSDPRSMGFPENHPHMQAFLGTPIQLGGQLFGMFYLADRIDGENFSAQDEWLLETLAGYVALAIAGSNLHEERERIALLEERQRISMELHDGVIQSLYAVGMHLDLLRMNGEVRPHDLLDAISELNHVIDDIRAYIMDLKLENARAETIRSCLKRMVQRLHVPPFIDVTIDAPDSHPLFPPSKFEAICQIINEALSNALRHSGAQHVKITALQNDSSLLVIVKDDGCGFDLSMVRENSGLGLRNIHHRAKMHGGHVHIDTAPDEGTRLTLTVPVNLPQEA